MRYEMGGTTKKFCDSVAGRIKHRTEIHPTGEEVGLWSRYCMLRLARAAEVDASHSSRNGALSTNCSEGVSMRPTAPDCRSSFI
jgi:hypothetical protein